MPKKYDLNLPSPLSVFAMFAVLKVIFLGSCLILVALFLVHIYSQLHAIFSKGILLDLVFIMASPSPTPALPSPPGMTFDPQDPRASVLWKWNVICQTGCLFFPTILFILRIYVRAWVNRVWILEDCESKLATCGPRTTVAESLLDTCCCAFVSKNIMSETYDSHCE